MKFLKLDLLTLLISLFLFNACENSSTVGLEVDPGITLDGNLVDTITIVSRSVAELPEQSYILSAHPFGRLTDPIFGTTTSNLAMTVNLASEGYSFGASPVLDSAVLVLNYAGGFYGDSTSKYSVEVHQLAKDLSEETSFLSNQTYPYQPALLGSKDGRIYPSTRYKVTEIVPDAKDTAKYVSPQMRIQLNKSFIQDNVLDLSNTIKKYNAAFKQSFKGLHLQINPGNSVGKGGLMFFSFHNSTPASYLSLYYRRQNAKDASKIDTVHVNFPISTYSGNSPVVASIHHDYTGTSVAAQLAAPPSQQFPVTYLQPMAGIKTKLDFPYIKNFAKNVGKIVINKAELVIGVNSGSDMIPYYSASRLMLYRYDIAGQARNIPDNDAPGQNYAGDPRQIANRGTYGGYYDVSKRQYVFVVTAYIQDLIDGKTENYGTFIAPSALGEFSSYISASRSVIGSFKKDPETGDPIMKLRIYYTNIK